MRRPLSCSRRDCCQTAWTDRPRVDLRELWGMLEMLKRGKLLKGLVGPWGLEPQTSTVSR